MRAMYSNAQWAWIGARWVEGHSQEELGEFLDMDRNTVRQNLHRRGFHYTRIADREDDDAARLPLDERKREFYALWDKEAL